MGPAYVVHIVAGSLSLVFGYVALYSPKGAALHRKTGMVFVYAMLTMSVAGLIIAAVRNVAPALNVPAGLLTAYLVITSLTTVRPPAAGARGLHIAAVVVALAVGLTSLTFGLEAVANGGERNGMPAFPFFMFGVVGLFGAIGDFRRLRSAPPRGGERIARHLWRMCFALFIAAMSFFFGQADVFPKPYRIMPLLAVPPFAVLGTMLYWVWRVRVRRSGRGLVGVPAAEDAVPGRP